MKLWYFNLDYRSIADVMAIPWLVPWFLNKKVKRGIQEYWLRKNKVKRRIQEVVVFQQGK